MAQLLRDNAADSRVADDVRALAAAYDERAVATAAHELAQSREDDLALLADAFAEPSSAEPWWSAATAQVLRYRWWVLAAVAVIAVILFVHPAPLPATSSDAGDQLIPTSDSQHAAALAPSVIPALPAADPFAFSLASPEPSFDQPATTDFATTPMTYAPAPKTLRITQSGYASEFAPTPAEQEPADGGLPVQTVGGQVMRYSYIRLAGNGTQLKLKATGSDSATSSTVRVQLCHITTAGWKPSRATPTSEAPKYDDQCLEGKANVASGVWSFNFSSIQNPTDPNGWAIVPVTADNATFDVTFSPTAAQ